MSEGTHWVVWEGWDNNGRLISSGCISTEPLAHDETIIKPLHDEEGLWFFKIQRNCTIIMKREQTLRQQLTNVWPKTPVVSWSKSPGVFRHCWFYVI